MTDYFAEAAKEARKATCQKDKCGSVIVANDGSIIGRGYNSPPGNSENQRRCMCDKKQLDTKITDKTCCVHAEQRAIMDALKNFPTKLVGSSLYFTRVDEQGEMIPSGQPYCTICSKIALDSGVSYFVLNHKTGPISYPTETYNLLSFEFKTTIEK